MNSPNKLKMKKESELCKDIKDYLAVRNGIPIPTIEDFCQRYSYLIKELKRFAEGSMEVDFMLESINTQAIVILDKFLLLDISHMEFKDENGRPYKLDKKGIIDKLKLLRKK